MSPYLLAGRLTLFCADGYRLKNPFEWLDLGEVNKAGLRWGDLHRRPGTVGRFLPTHRLQIALSHTENGCLARVEWKGQVLLGYLLWAN